MEAMWTEYERFLAAIELEEGVNLEVEEKYKNEFEDLFFRNMALAEIIIMPRSDVLGKNASQIGNRNDQCNLNQSHRLMSTITLAAINVPSFSGNYQKSALIYGVFSAPNNVSLSAVEKCIYLRLSLSSDTLYSKKC